MSKKTVYMVIILFLFTMFLYTGCRTQLPPKSGLAIDGWSSSLGGVSQTYLDNTKFSYTIHLTNENETEIYVTSIQPTVSDKAKSRVISPDTVIDVNKPIKPNDTIQISGEILFDTKGMGKPEIEKLEPFITDIKVSSEEIVSLK